METKNLYGEGLVGLNVTLNIADMQAVRSVLDRFDAAEAARAWDEAFRQARWKNDALTREEFAVEHPAPATPVERFDSAKELKTVMVFLRKIAAAETAKATIFEEEE